MAKSKISFRRTWKKFWDKILGFGPVQWLIAVIIAMPIWFIYLTCRVRITNCDLLKEYQKKQAIFVFWHGRLMMLWPLIIKGKIRSYVIASQHHDGTIMAKAQQLFGLHPLYGSTSHGGASVLRAGLRALMDGKSSMCISPDGPGGPSLRVQDGALYFAKMAGVPIVPVCFSASRAKFLKRWDRFVVVKPFSKITYTVGQEFIIPRRASQQEIESVRKEIEDYMVDMVHKMDAEYGHKMVEQDFTAGGFKDAVRAERAARRNKHKGIK